MADLTFDEASKLLAYDPESGLLTWKVTRTKAVAGRVTGRRNSEGYLEVRTQDKLYKAHRLAWLLYYGAWPSQQLDHIDGDRANNRIGNLRQCSNAENQQNACRRSDNTSGVPGVTLHKSGNKWKAQIVIDGKYIYLGLFETIEEATAARAAAKARYHTFNPVARE